MHRKTFTLTMPEGARLLSPRRAIVELANGKHQEYKVNKSGRIVVQSKNWYGYVRLANGKRKEVALCKSRTDALKLLVKKRDREFLVSKGLEFEKSEDSTKPLLALADDWLDELSAAGRNSVRVAVNRARILWMLKAANLVNLPDLARPSAAMAIGEALKARKGDSKPLSLPKGETFKPEEIRALLGISGSGLWKVAKLHGVTGSGNGKAKEYSREEAAKLIAAKKQTFSPNTINGYRLAIGSFCRWLVKRNLLDRVPYLPLKVDEKFDRRLIRRAITWEDCRKLGDSTKALGKVRGGMTAESRSILYRVAFVTLLRARALRELMPKDCELEGKNPSLSIRAETDKTGRARAVPLPPDVAIEIGSLLRHQPKNKPVWAMPAAMVQVLRDDLADAGIPFRTDDGVCDFHALRHSGATHLAKLNKPLDRIAKIGGWTNLQQFFTRYGHYSIESLGQAIEGAY